MKQTNKHTKKKYVSPDKINYGFTLLNLKWDFNFV